jgi:hypothetical protein
MASLGLSNLIVEQLDEDKEPVHRPPHLQRRVLWALCWSS